MSAAEGTSAALAAAALRRAPLCGFFFMAVCFFVWAFWPIEQQGELQRSHVSPKLDRNAAAAAAVVVVVVDCDYLGGVLSPMHLHTDEWGVASALGCAVIRQATAENCEPFQAFGRREALGSAEAIDSFTMLCK